MPPKKKAAPIKKAAAKKVAKKVTKKGDPEVERPFKMKLLVTVEGFGLVEHQRKAAANVKRMLHTGLHQEVDVSRIDLTTSGQIMFIEKMELSDRNALAGWDDPPRAN